MCVYYTVHPIKVLVIRLIDTGVSSLVGLMSAFER